MDQDLARYRALAHPLRLRILEVVRRQGPMTATEIGRVVGESPANCSFHLRMLADGGFVEPDDSGLDRRHHPWRARTAEFHIDPQSGTASQRAAARDAVAALRNRDSEALKEWDLRSEFAPQEWRDASFEKTEWRRLSAEQLMTLREAWQKVLDELPDSSDHKESVQIQMIAFPLRIDW